MRAFLVFTHSGPILVLTSCQHITEESLLETFQGRGIDKFIAYEVPFELATERYGVDAESLHTTLRQTCRDLSPYPEYLLEFELALGIDNRKPTVAIASKQVHCAGVTDHPECGLVGATFTQQLRKEEI